MTMSPIARMLLQPRTANPVQIDTTSNSEAEAIAAPTEGRKIMVTYIEYSNAGATDTVIHLLENGGTAKYKVMCAANGGGYVRNLLGCEWFLTPNTSLRYKQSVNSNQIYITIGAIVV